MTTAIQRAPLPVYPLIERARAAAAEDAIQEAKYAAEQRLSAIASAKAVLTNRIESVLGATVDPTAIEIDETGPGFGRVHARAVVDGLLFEAETFGTELQLVRRCTYEHCAAQNESVKTTINNLLSLGRALAVPAEHDPHGHRCGIIYDEDGEALSDNQGRHIQRRPRPIPFDREQRAIDDVLAAAEVYAQAVRSVMELEDLRPLLKAKAIGEMLGTPNPLGKPGALHSASSAEAVVEQHGEYWQHRQKQAQAEVERIRAHAALDVAKMRARLAINAMRAGDDDA